MKRRKKYFKVPDVKDFYSGRVGKVELDAEIKDAVKIFCELGYITIASCSGHRVKDKIDYGYGPVSYTEGYIWFERMPAKRVPRGFRHDKFSSCLRWRNTSAREYREKHIRLLKWAKSL